MRKHLTIAGAGPAGLAVGYYARRQGWDCTLFEAAPRSGGTCITFRQGDFLFDSGAHRFHDKIPAVTQEILQLMAGNLALVQAPSQIFSQGAFVDFPLSPLDLMAKLGFASMAKSGLDLFKERLRPSRPAVTFEDFAIRTYGRTIADAFLLTYSEKLWGKPCRQLSPRIAGKRMQGLNMRTFLKEAFRGKMSKTEHLDGTFYYPTRGGIGAITDRLAESCGVENIRLNTPVSKILHRKGRVTHLVVNDHATAPVEFLVNTLPITRFLDMMDPPPPADVRAFAAALNYRNILLVALFLNRPSVTRNASVYFPSGDFPFTRVYEPNNRNPAMSPPGKASLIVEIPYQAGDAQGVLNDEALTDQVTDRLVRIGWIRREEILSTAVKRLSDAYPIMEIGFEERVAGIMRYLREFPNLRISGRNGKFVYTHLHDMMQFGRDIVEDLRKVTPA